MSLGMLRRKPHPLGLQLSHSPYIWTRGFAAQWHLTRYVKSDSGFGSDLSMDYGTMCTLKQVYRQQGLPSHLTPIAKTIPAGPHSDLRGYFPKFLL